jgi:ribonuclease BN (tRNA processing enzyme)
MQLQILGSSSKGNCYLLKTESEILIIEAGIKLSEVKKAIDFDLSKVVACLCTHQHNDHAGNIIDFMNAGIIVMALEEVFASKYISEHSAYSKFITPNHGYKVGNFKVYAFAVSHDVPCLGFTIDHPESGKILFLTDTMTCDYSFTGLNHFLIEANYADSVLDANIKAGKVPPSMRHRLLSTHMELETTKKIINNHDISNVRNIVLIHLSDGNSNENRFIEEIQAVTGKPVFAANKGMKLNFSLNPF